MHLAGVLKKVRFGSFEIETSSRDTSIGKETEELAKISSDDKNSSNEVPYESKQLANYYTQILNQSKISFWFSLIFASLGFTVILASVMLYNSEKVGTTVASFVLVQLLMQYQLCFSSSLRVPKKL